MFNIDKFRSSIKLVCVIGQDYGGCMIGGGLHNRDLRARFGLDWRPPEDDIVHHEGLYYLVARCWGDGNTELSISDDDDMDYPLSEGEPYEVYLNILNRTSFIVRGKRGYNFSLFL